MLSSTAVHLGEHGSIHDLAESEIYRWANVRGYVALHRTQPIYLSENRCMMHLRLTGVRLGMEQVVVYTRLSCGIPCPNGKTTRPPPCLPPQPLL